MKKYKKMSSFKNSVHSILPREKTVFIKEIFVVIFGAVFRGEATGAGGLL